MAVVLLFSLGHQPVAHLLVGLTRQGAVHVASRFPASHKRKAGLSIATSE
jgi:hypothetical protein